MITFRQWQSPAETDQTRSLQAKGKDVRDGGPNASSLSSSETNKGQHILVYDESNVDIGRREKKKGEEKEARAQDSSMPSGRLRVPVSRI